MAYRERLIAAGNGDDEAAKIKAQKEISKGEALEGKLAARTHDEVNLLWVCGMLGLTLWCFVAHSPYQDALEARVASASALGFAPEDPPEAPPIYFWLAPVQRGTPGWALPAEYMWLTWAALVYSVFDIVYILAVPACTTKQATILPHHVATITLTSGALWLGVAPLTAHCLLVELNTLVLTLKNLKRAPTVQQGRFSRLVHGAGVALHDVIQPVVHPAFILSWVSLRLVFYPFLLLTFHRYFGHPRFHGLGYAYVQSSLLALNVLNQWWTFGIMGAGFVLGMALATAALLFFFC